MELSEEGIVRKYAKVSGQCNQNTLLPYEHEFICVSCGHNVKRRKHEISKIQRKKINLIDRLMYAGQKLFCICADVYKIYEGNDYDKIYKALSELKTKQYLNREI